jgi:hypothetical protein
MTGDEPFSRSALASDGFNGWLPFAPMRAEIDSVPSSGGVYVVTRLSDDVPAFLTSNPGGHFKSRDPTVSNEALRANWVDGARVVYIGKADQLRRRLRQFADFGAGRPVGHWGGRLIWQLAASGKLLVAWKQTPGRVPREVEAAMIEDFRIAYGKPPFANEPHRLGR